MSLSLWKKKIEKDLSEMKRAAPGSGRDNDSVWRQGKKKEKRTLLAFKAVNVIAFTKNCFQKHFLCLMDV